jgi:hypothetical protein
LDKIVFPDGRTKQILEIGRLKTEAEKNRKGQFNNGAE